VVFQIKKSNNSSRISDFLEEIHLAGQLNSEKVSSDLNFDESDELLRDYIASSKKYLEHSL
jgi:hypothetical protein